MKRDVIILPVDIISRTERLLCMNGTYSLI